MRVITGEFRGRKLFVPKGNVTRPTTDYMRQALFNILGDGVVDIRALDLYAGSGSVGIEALSRGAEHVTFVEKNPRVLPVLKRNLDTIGVDPKRYTVIQADAQSFRPKQVTWRLIFADPPYDVLYLPLAPLAEAVGSHESLLVVEHSTKHTPDETEANVVLVDRREHGQSCFSFYEFAQRE